MSLVDDISGKAKEVTGEVTGDDKLKAEGKLDQIKGDLKDRVEETKDKVGDAVNEGLDKVRDKLDGDDESR